MSWTTIVFLTDGDPGPSNNPNIGFTMTAQLGLFLGCGRVHRIARFSKQYDLYSG